MKRVVDPELLRWLADRAPVEGDVAGYDAVGWDASVWILHAMYENDQLPAGISHDDVDRSERAAGTTERSTIGEAVEDVLSDATLVGSPLGRSGWPGAGWQRLLWTELAGRLDVDPFAIDVPPCHRSFPYTSWPVSIAPPGEGSLDREQFVRLVEHLAAATPEGSHASVLAFYAMCAVGEFDDHVIYSGELLGLVELYDDEDLPGSPNNLWPDERSWFLYTDWDLWATKVSGSADLVERLNSDAALETVSLAF